MTPTHVVVAGGGVTGLTAAFTAQAEALRLGIAVDVTVIEAAAEAGGHARTIVDGDWVIDARAAGLAAAGAVFALRRNWLLAAVAAAAIVAAAVRLGF